MAPWFNGEVQRPEMVNRRKAGSGQPGKEVSFFMPFIRGHRWINPHIRVVVTAKTNQPHHNAHRAAAGLAARQLALVASRRPFLGLVRCAAYINDCVNWKLYAEEAH